MDFLENFEVPPRTWRGDLPWDSLTAFVSARLVENSAATIGAVAFDPTHHGEQLGDGRTATGWEFFAGDETDAELSDPNCVQLLTLSWLVARAPQLEALFAGHDGSEASWVAAADGELVRWRDDGGREKPPEEAAPQRSEATSSPRGTPPNFVANLWQLDGTITLGDLRGISHESALILGAARQGEDLALLTCGPADDHNVIHGYVLGSSDTVLDRFVGGRGPSVSTWKDTPTGPDCLLRLWSYLPGVEDPRNAPDPTRPLIHTEMASPRQILWASTVTIT